MLEKTTVAIAPEAALRAVSAENEWRRKYALVLEMRLLEAEARIAELEAGQKGDQASEPEKPAQVVKASKPSAEKPSAEKPSAEKPEGK